MTSGYVFSETPPGVKPTGRCNAPERSFACGARAGRGLMSMRLRINNVYACHMAEAVVSTEGLPVGSYIANVFVRPRDAFRHLPAQRRATWWVIFALLAFALIAPTVLSQQRVMTRMFERAIAPPVDPANPAPVGAQGGPVNPNPGPGVPPEFRPEPPGPLMALLGAGMGLIGTVVSWAAWSIVLLFGIAIGGGRSSFGDLFKLSLSAALPLFLRALLQLGYLLISGGVLGMPGLSGLALPSPLAAVAPGAIVQPPGFGAQALGSLLSYVDAFQLANLLLLAIGLTTLARMSMVRALVLVLVCVAIFSVLGALPDLIGGALTAV
jgi:hypothetical protein